ncbi:alpha/beta hydrolase family protein [Arthrobacter sp. A2-55]|uniref:alpha/beta hydrolase family protein n=1 Tax=Arthrobacter sp. A2-55 TaxID=2897337 RepID=UPI0021CDE451|nr:alpha/beta fold hydrolase [Arthrobacter sp. A2-55]MCU6481911.1 alpha/beta fold hydrolase [Arthrobacter sp. A2-55]
MRGILLAAAGGLAAVSTVAAGAYFANRAITPWKSRKEGVDILSYTDRQVVLAQSPDTLTPGTFSLYFQGNSGHARIGAITGLDPASGTVTRTVESVDYGDLAGARKGYWSGYAYPGPSALGLPFQELSIATPAGPAPAWLYGPLGSPGVANGIWVIHIHGLGGKRATGLRTVPAFARAGASSLLVSYRGDREARDTPAGKHTFGQTEVDDVAAALEYAASRGASQVILAGWSMGATMALELAVQPKYKDLVAGLILIAPVLDWAGTLSVHARASHLPRAAVKTGLSLMSCRLPSRWLGLPEPIDFKHLDWVCRAPEIRQPTLILHSKDDGSAPYNDSLTFRQRTAGETTVVTFNGAKHTQEWNADARLWESSVERWLHDQIGLGPHSPA